MKDSKKNELKDEQLNQATGGRGEDQSTHLRKDICPVCGGQMDLKMGPAGDGVYFECSDCGKKKYLTEA